MDNIKKVTPGELRQIIDARQPLGLFYALENKTYTAVDNSTGNAWTEPFPCLYDCKRWLSNPHLSAEVEK